MEKNTMKKRRQIGRLLRVATLLLSVLLLTACPQRPQVILQDSAPIRILPGELPKSPAAKGWLLSDQATAKLLEAAKACKGK